MEPQAHPDTVNKEVEGKCKWAGKGEIMVEVIEWKFDGF